jgi:uncharacterized protein YycO
MGTMFSEGVVILTQPTMQVMGTMFSEGDVILMQQTSADQCHHSGHMGRHA